jgi:hypothetical protein
MLSTEKLQQLALAITTALQQRNPDGSLIESMEISQATGELLVQYTGNPNVVSLGVVVGSDGDSGNDGVSVINVQLATDSLRPGEVFFAIELSNGVILQTNDSIVGYNGKSIENVYLDNNSFYFVLEGGEELPPMPVSGLTPVSITGGRIENNDLIFTLSNGSEINVGVSGDLRGVGVSSMTFEDGVLQITYTDNPTPQTLGTIKSIDTLQVTNAKLMVKYNTSPTSEELSDFVYFTGAEVVGNELILITNQTAPNNKINLGPVANLKGDTGDGIQSVVLTDNALVITLTNDVVLPPIPVSGLTPISVVGARYDVVENEIYLQLSNSTEIPTGIGANFKGDTGRGIQDVEVTTAGALNVYFTDAPSTPVQAGTIPSVLNVFVEEGVLKIRYNTDPDNPITLGELKSIVEVKNVSGNIVVTYNTGTEEIVGNVRSVSNMSIVNGNLQVTYSNGDSAVLGSVIGPQGVGFQSALVNPDGDLILIKTNNEQVNVGQVRQTSTNLLGNISKFVATLNQVDFAVNHSGTVLVFAGSRLMDESEYSTVLLDRITLNTPEAENTLITIIVFNETAITVANKGIASVDDVNGVYTITLLDSTQFTIDTNQPADTTELPPGIVSIEIVNNELIVTLSNDEIINAGVTSTSVTVTGASIVNGNLIITLSDSTEINAGVVVSNLSISNITVNENGHLIITMTNEQIFDAGVAGKYVTGTEIRAGELIILLSDNTEINAGLIVTPTIGQLFDYVCFEGQFEFPIAHNGYQVLVYAEGSCLDRDSIDLTTPFVRLTNPRAENDLVRIVLLTSGQVQATGIVGEDSAPDNSVYGKREGIVGFFPANLTAIGKPYYKTLTAGQTTITDVYHNGQVLVWLNDSFLHPDQYTLPLDNRRVLLVTPAVENDRIAILALQNSSPMGDMIQDNFCKVTYDTNSHGGTFTANAWRTRPLNNITQNGLGATVANNRIILESGIYFVQGWAACQGVTTNGIRLYNTTNQSVVLLGPTVFSSRSNSSTQVDANTLTPISGYFVLSTQSALQLQHKSLTSKATIGFGAVGTGLGSGLTQANYGTSACLTELNIWKVG